MRKKPVITATQLMLMAVGSALIFPYTFMPILITPPANQDMWIVLLMSVFYIILLNAPLLFLINKFRGNSANQTLEMILGKPAGRVAAIPFVLFFLFCQTACLMISGQFITIYLTPETPAWALLALMVVPICYASYKGAGTIGRLAPFFVPFLLVTVVSFFLFGIDKMDLSELQPALADSTFLQLNEGAFFTAARFSEILIFFVFSYYLGKQASVLKTYATAIGVFIVSYMLILISTILVLGDEFAKHIWSAYFVFSRQVEAFGFLERVQAFNVLAWFPCSILKLTMYNYMASHVFSGIVRAKSYKVFVIPFVLMAYIICLLPVMQKTSTFEFLSSDKFFPFMILPVIFVLPLIILSVYLIRKKKINLLLAQKLSAEDTSK